VIVHLFLTPHTPQSAGAGTWYVPVECGADASRRVTCQVMLGTGPALTGNLQSGAADYLMVATVASGANP
jgi:hypothetical protein